MIQIFFRKGGGAMQPMSSKDIYYQACENRQSSALKKQGKKFLYETYINLVRTMFCELVLDSKSDLITHLCKLNNISFDAKNFECFQSYYTPEKRGWSQDLFLLLGGLRALFRNKLSELMVDFDDFSTYLFSKAAPKDPPRGDPITELLQDIDQELGRINGIAPAQSDLHWREVEGLPLSGSQSQRASFQDSPGKPGGMLSEQELRQLQQRLNYREQELNQLLQHLNNKAQALNEQQRILEIQQQKALEQQTLAKQVQQAPKSPERIEAARQAEEKLQKLSQARQADDTRLLEQLQKLQSKMQEGLQEIMQTREDIEYAAMQEAISQLLQLHELLWEALRYHPGSGQSDYMNLVDSCNDFRENIIQALAMLGAEPINSTDVPYNPAYHQAKQSGLVTRDAVVRRVLRPGFQYKKKVLEKALVEL